MVDVAVHIAPRGRLAAADIATSRVEVAVSNLSPDWIGCYAAFAAEHAHGAAQSPTWLKAWSRHAAADIVTLTLSEGGVPWLMLPLEVVRQGLFTSARFIGGSHANSNLPACNALHASKLTASARKALARAIRKARPDIDLLLFERMVPTAAGAAVPLLAFGGSRSPNPVLSLTLEGGFEAVLKRSTDQRKAKKHRSHGRRFEEAGGFRRIEARSDAEVDRLLGEFFQFKKTRFAKAGIPDVFADPQIKASFGALFRDALKEGEPPFLLHALEVGGIIRAITGSSRQGGTLTCEFGAIRDDELGRYSPGEFLFYRTIQAACEEGFEVYDFGVGDERYKRLWCGIETNTLDVAVPISIKGKLLQMALGAAARVKLAVKRNPTLWKLVKRLRRETAGQTVPDEEKADA